MHFIPFPLNLPDVSLVFPQGEHHLYQHCLHCSLLLLALVAHIELRVEAILLRGFRKELAQGLIKRFINRSVFSNFCGKFLLYF